MPILLGLLLGVAVGAGGAAALGPRLDRRTVARRAERVRAHARGGVEGTLVTDAPIETRIGEGAERIEDDAVMDASTTAPRRVALRVGAEEIALEGPLQVVVGSHETVGRRPPVRRLSNGDRVLVSGAREGARIVPALDLEWTSRPIGLAYAGDPVPMGRSRAWSRVAAFAAAGALAGIAAGFAMDARTGARAGSRATDETCWAAIDRAIEGGRPWDAAPRVDACGDPVRTARVRWLLGDFDAASRAFASIHPRERCISEIEAHVVARRADLAAVALGEWIAQRGDTLGAQKRTHADCALRALEGAPCNWRAPRESLTYPERILTEPDHYERSVDLGLLAHPPADSAPAVRAVDAALVGFFAARMGESERALAALRVFDTLAPPAPDPEGTTPPGMPAFDRTAQMNAAYVATIAAAVAGDRARALALMDAVADADGPTSIRDPDRVRSDVDALTTTGAAAFTEEREQEGPVNRVLFELAAAGDGASMADRLTREGWEGAA